MLTYEFPTPEKAKEFSDRMICDGFGNPKRSHRVVDVDEGDGSDPFAHDYVVLLAAYYGAAEARASLRAAREGGDRLYTLHTWDRDDEPRHTSVCITTLAEFAEDNPNLALAVLQTIAREGTFTGGGGAQPCWRITRTPFVGFRRDDGDREAIANRVAEESVARKMSWEDVCAHVHAATGKTVTHETDALYGLTARECQQVLDHMRTS